MAWPTWQVNIRTNTLPIEQSCTLTVQAQQLSEQMGLDLNGGNVFVHELQVVVAQLVLRLQNVAHDSRQFLEGFKVARILPQVLLPPA
jgi:hypothetical protein